MLRRAYFRLIFLTVVVASLYCAVEGQSGDWLSVRSKNFSISGNSSPEQLRSTAARLEQFRWAFSQLYPDLKLDNGKPTEIVVFRDGAVFSEFLPKRTDGTTDIGVAGYFQAGDDLNYITFASSESQHDPFSTAVHEYVHSIMDANFEKVWLPPWLNEGLAEYFETLNVENDGLIVTGGQQAEHIKQLRRFAAIPLPIFFSISSADLRSMPPERRKLFYSQAWAVVHSLMRTGKISLSNLSTAARSYSFTDPSSDERRSAYVELEKELDRMVRSVENSYSDRHPVVSAVPHIEIPQPVAITEAKTAYLLGDLLLHTGELEKSEPYLRRAAALSNDDPSINGALGVLLTRRDAVNEARPLLQKAVAGGSKSCVVLVSYAYSLLHDSSTGNQLREISDDLTGAVRLVLNRAMEISPRFTESYRLLALVDFIRDENLDEAISLLQKGLAIKNDAVDMQLLLARILLRREDVTRAGQIAAQIAATTTDTARRAEANEIVKAVYDYGQARASSQNVTRVNVSLGERQSFVVLKRSWLTDADLTQIKDDLNNNNFNRIIFRPASDELQLVGRVENITCSGSSITYSVQTSDSVFRLSSADFANVRMNVAREGDSTFQIGCGAKLEKELAVITYRPNHAPTANHSVGDLISISFVPENFRLKSLQEMAAARLVAIDDDTVRKSGPAFIPDADSIHRSIERSLRKPAKDEIRVLGILERIDCSSGRAIFMMSAGNKNYRLARVAGDKLEIGWFTVASTQLPLTCGIGSMKVSAIFTFASQNGEIDGELRAIEFVPTGFVL